MADSTYLRHLAFTMLRLAAETKDRKLREYYERKAARHLAEADSTEQAEEAFPSVLLPADEPARTKLH